MEASCPTLMSSSITEDSRPFGGSHPQIQFHDSSNVSSDDYDGESSEGSSEVRGPVIKGRLIVAGKLRSKSGENAEEALERSNKKLRQRPGELTLHRETAQLRAGEGSNSEYNLPPKRPSQSGEGASYSSDRHVHPKRPSRVKNVYRRYYAVITKESLLFFKSGTKNDARLLTSP